MKILKNTQRVKQNRTGSLFGTRCDCCGMAGGAGLHTTVFPMILRGVSLLGVSSANCPIDTRRKLWDRLGNEWKPPHLDEIIRNEVELDQMDAVFGQMLAGESLGRTVVRIEGTG